MHKVAIFAFNGEPSCFVHAMINALDLDEKGVDVALVIEGTATKMVKELADPDKPHASFYAKVRDKGLIDAVCKACANQTGSLYAAMEQGLPINSDLRQKIV